jgi:hypothetical protein
MSKELVFVACKLPHGLLVEVGTVGHENYFRQEVAGPNTGIRKGKHTSLLVGGYAFTPVPKDHWEEFVKKHKGAQYLKTRAVYAEATLEGAQAAALTDGQTRLGFERLNPDKPAPGIEPDADHLKGLQRISA